MNCMGAKQLSMQISVVAPIFQKHAVQSSCILALSTFYKIENPAKETPSCSLWEQSNLAVLKDSSKRERDKLIFRFCLFVFCFPAECHSSCAGCIGNTSQDCTACLSSHLLLEGRCLSRCPEGLFSQQDHCSCKCVVQAPAAYTAEFHCVHFL